MTAAPESKPFDALSAFAAQLGWRDLRIHQTVSPDSNELITWYTSGDDRYDDDCLFLQINECPIGQARTYTCAVYALRFGIHTGWHSMQLDNVSGDVERLFSWLRRDWFTEDHLRKEFLDQHPECGDWTWERLQKGPPGPYVVDDAENCVTGPARDMR